MQNFASDMDDFHAFQKILAQWFALNRRDLPWRHTRDPYLIWISEIILQQTQVAQGLDYYRRFVAHFPDVRSLAAAPIDEVLKLWQGLGYYSRARHLHASAKIIVERFGGVFPTAHTDVLALKGVGQYTAAVSVRSLLGSLLPRSMAMFFVFWLAILAAICPSTRRLGRNILTNWRNCCSTPKIQGCTIKH